MMSVREDIAGIAQRFRLYTGMDYSEEVGYETLLQLADEILSHPRIAILSEDQSLPVEPTFYDDWGGQSGRQGYVSAHEDMISAGFRRVEMP